VNIQDLFDDARCYQTIREMRWPDGVTCPHCSSDSVIKNGRDDAAAHRQRYACRGCRRRFDDLTDTIFAGHHQPLRTWVACLYLMGLNLSGLQIAQELDINKDDARAMIGRLRQGIVERRPPVVLEGEVECDEVDVVAGHKGHPDAVKNKALRTFQWVRFGVQKDKKEGPFHARYRCLLQIVESPKAMVGGPRLSRFRGTTSRRLASVLTQKIVF
jgi:transposase-like protein